MQTLFKPPLSSPRREIDIRALLKRARLGPRGAKVAVILVFTLCWIFVALIRSNAVHDPLSVEASSLVGLATSMHHGAVSGRDFQSMYGPGMQLLASAATTVTKTDSPIEAYGKILFLFCTFSALLIAAMLGSCDRFTWQDCGIVYTFCFLLNLFFNLPDYRTAVLLLSAVVVYRTIAAPRMRHQFVWATAAGLLCFVSQLLTFELGIYVFVLIMAGLAGGAILTRNTRGLVEIEVFVSTLATANVVLAFFFKLTSANYALLFDYQNYSFEILRGFHNSMGMLWQLPLPQTIVLVLAIMYMVYSCIRIGLNSDPLDASLLAVLGFAALIWLKTAAVHSDIPHITVAFTPMVVVLALIATKVWKIKPVGHMWGGTLVLLLIVWPSFNVSAPRDLVRAVRGQIASGALIGVSQPHNIQADLVPGLMTSDLADRSRVSRVTYSDSSPSAIEHAHQFFPPALETYAAFTPPLERYYIEALDQQRGEGLDIALADVPTITRTPGIFEYLYRHFALVGHEDHGDGHYELHERYEPREARLEQLSFSTPQQLPDQGMVKLTAPTTCGIVRLQMRIEYEKNTLLFRPSGVELSLRNSGQLVWNGSARPLLLDRPSVAIVTTLPDASFQNVFNQGPLQTPKWNTIEYSASPADLLGAKARSIRIETIQCLDPARFAEALLVSEAALVK